MLWKSIFQEILLEESNIYAGDKKRLWKNVDILGIRNIRGIQSYMEVPVLNFGIVDSSGGFCAIKPLILLKPISEEAAELILDSLNMGRVQGLLEVTEISFYLQWGNGTWHANVTFIFGICNECADNQL